MPTLGEFQQAVAQRIQDDAHKLAQPAIDACIGKTLKGRYAQVRPLEKIAELAGDSATFEWLLTGDDQNAAFAAWVESFSGIKSLEYPAGERIPEYLDPEDWTILRNGDGVLVLRLLTITPATGKSLRVLWTAPHAADASTVPAVDFEGCADLAASYACVALAAAYNQLVDPVFSAPTDGAHQTKSQHYLALAKKYEGQFEGAFGLNAETKQAPGSGWVEWPTNVDTNDERLTH